MKTLKLSSHGIYGYLLLWQILILLNSWTSKRALIMQYVELTQPGKLIPYN
jgi:hypothetical protein